MGHSWRYTGPGRLRLRRHHRLWRVATEQRSWYVRNGASGATLVNGVVWGQFGDCPVAARLGGEDPGPMELNVWRPSTASGSLRGRLRAWVELPSRLGPTAIYRSHWIWTIPATASSSCFVRRPARGTACSEFRHHLGTAGGYPGPPFGSDGRSTLGSQRVPPTTGLIYNCFSPAGSTCTAGTTSHGSPGPPGVVAIPGRGK